MDISLVKERTGLTSATLHHYESVGLLEPIGRAGIRRQYGEDVLEILAVIALCQQSGFTLEEIRGLMAKRRNSEWKAMANSKLLEIEERIRSLEQARNGLRHALECPSRDIMRCEHFRSTLASVYPEP
jgi:DNA-binding transcriptional MerR regulator